MSVVVGSEWGFSVKQHWGISVSAYTDLVADFLSGTCDVNGDGTNDVVVGFLWPT